VALVLLITMIPLSIAGFGLREGGWVLVLGAAGVSATDATLLSLLTFAALAVATLPAALCMLKPVPRASPLPGAEDGVPSSAYHAAIVPTLVSAEQGARAPAPPEAR
jgi:hypothetical protein